MLKLLVCNDYEFALHSLIMLTFRRNRRTDHMLTRAITAEEIKTYDRDGNVCLRGLFNTDTVEMLREAAE